MSLFDLIESEEPASVPDSFDMDQFVQGRKALTRDGRIASFVGFGRSHYDDSPHVVISLPCDPIRQGKGKSHCNYWVTLDGRWSPIDDGPGGGPTLVALI